MVRLVKASRTDPADSSSGTGGKFLAAAFALAGAREKGED
jgi:hypothetical protein